MNLFLEALNRPADAFKRRNNRLSWIFIITAILVVVVFDPLTNYFVNRKNFLVTVDPLKMILMFIAGVGTYLVVCTMFWFICKAFGSKTSIYMYIKAWGISYVPTIICAVTVTFAETFFFVFWNNSMWGILLSIVFIGVLIWKAILYVIFLREVGNLSGKRLAGAFILCGVVILIFAFMDIFLGLKTPIL